MYFRYNAISGSVGNNVVEPGNTENMGAGVGILFPILFPAVLCAEIVLLPFLGRRHIYFQRDFR